MRGSVDRGPHGLEELGGRIVGPMSGGQKRRIALAAAVTGLLVIWLADQVAGPRVPALFVAGMQLAKGR